METETETIGEGVAFLHWAYARWPTVWCAYVDPSCGPTHDRWGNLNAIKMWRCGEK